MQQYNAKYAGILSGLIFLIALSVWVARNFHVGGGQSAVTAPEVAKAGLPVVIKLDNVAWGRDIKGRYTEVVLFYRLVGHSAYKTIPARFISTSDNKFEENEFIIPAFPNGTVGEIEFYFEMKFDGVPKHVGVSRNIKIVSP